MILQKLEVINVCHTQVSRGDRRGLHHHLRRVPGLRVPLQAGAGAWPVYPVRRLAPAPPPSPPRAPVPVPQCRQL